MKFEWKEHPHYVVSAITKIHSYSYFVLTYGDKKVGEYLQEYEGWRERKKVYRIGLNDAPEYTDTEIRETLITRYRQKLLNELQALDDFEFEQNFNFASEE